MTQKTKLFISGNSQAVRLPKEFRLDEDEIYIRRDANTGDIILSLRPTSWEDFFKLRAKTTVPDDFLRDRERAQSNAPRDPFEGWTE